MITMEMEQQKQINNINVNGSESQVLTNSNNDQEPSSSSSQINSNVIHDENIYYSPIIPVANANKNNLLPSANLNVENNDNNIINSNDDSNNIDMKISSNTNANKLLGNTKNVNSKSSSLLIPAQSINDNNDSNKNGHMNSVINQASKQKDDNDFIVINYRNSQLCFKGESFIKLMTFLLAFFHTLKPTFAEAKELQSLLTQDV